MIEPPYSCPYLDSAIQEIENARKIHDDLRSWGHYWREKFEDLERDSSREIDSLKEDISQLEDRLGDTEAELRDAREELSKL